MSGKFMKIKRVIIPTLTMLMIASQLTGCVAVKESEMLTMINNQQAICITIPEMIDGEEKEERDINWVELAYKETYPEFRLNFEDILGITAFGEGGKNGTVYVDLEGNHTNNSTLSFALANNKFRAQLNDTDTYRELLELTKSTYIDVNSDAEAKLAMYNAYFEILADVEPNQFCGSNIITRAELLGAIYRADNQVQKLDVPEEISSILDSTGENNDIAFVNELLDYSYLNLSEKSLTEDNLNASLTRAEAIYTIVKYFYADEYNAVSGDEKCFSDAKNGGNIALKQKFIEEHKNKETKEVTTEYKDYWMAYELQYALDNSDKGMPDDLYKAMVVAKQEGLITGNECRWTEPITKAEALNFIIKVYESMPHVTNADRGKAVTESEIINNTEETVDDMQVVKDKIEENQAAYSLDDLYERLKLTNLEKDADGNYIPTEDWISAVNDATDGWSNDGWDTDFMYLANFLGKFLDANATGKETYDWLIITPPGTESLRDWAAPFYKNQGTTNNTGNTGNTQAPSGGESNSGNTNNGGGNQQQQPPVQEQTPPSGGGGSLDHLFPDAGESDLAGATSDWDPNDPKYSGIKLQ